MGRAFMYVILGGGVAAGYAALEFARRGGYSRGELCIISEEAVAPYERPALSKGYLLSEDAARLPGFHTCVGANDELLTTKWYKEQGIELVLGTKVIYADVRRKTLLTGTGETISYKTLIIATGARALKLQEFGIQGSDAPNICYLRNIDDADKLVNVMKSSPGGNAVVIGGGYIGMECAAALVTNKIRVTMVFPEKHCMGRLFTPKIAEYYENYYASKGVTFVQGTVLTSFEKDTTGKICQSFFISLYADDVVIFIRPVPEEMQITTQILDKFGEASGLQTNLQKSCVVPIRCDQERLDLVEQHLPCTPAAFPCTYLGLPVSDKKLGKADLWPWIEKIGNKLPGWKASLMNMAGRATWVKFVMSAIPIYVLIAIKVPKWFIKAIDKTRRAFLWKGRKQINGGACLVSWEKVQRPLELGGLGVLNLEVMSWALQARWLWFQKIGKNCPWKGLDIPIHSNAVALLDISIVSHIGNGSNTLFWKDKWLFGATIGEVAPSVLAVIPTKIIKTRTVGEALSNNSWVSDIKGSLSMVGLFEFFHLWEAMQGVSLTDEDDDHAWKFTSSGVFSTKSAYRAFFYGSISFEPWKRIWKAWAPPKCKIFIWLAVLNRCWTADRLARRGLPHPEQCVLCDQEGEDINHILISCVFSREFWFRIFIQLGFEDRVPDPQDQSFSEWWRKACKHLPKEKRKGMHSLIIWGLGVSGNIATPVSLKGCSLVCGLPFRPSRTTTISGVPPELVDYKA